MRRHIHTFWFLTLTAIIFAGCDLNPLSHSKILVSHMAVTDTSGQAISDIRSGEYFDVALTIVNKTGGDQKYHYGYPQASFQVVRVDSVHISSDYGCMYPLPRRSRTLEEGDVLVWRWRGPMQGCTEEKVNLEPGKYLILARPGLHFEKYGTLRPEYETIRIKP
ncbi:MAG: hypothetical protein R6U28_08085 [Cyclonatronaceae bacterium]